MEELSKIQSEISCVKGRVNKFGNYNYYNLSDVLKALKPLIAKYGVTITLSHEVFPIDGIFFVKSTATIKNKNGETETSSAVVEVQRDKKGMSSEMCSASAMSYSGKVAISGLCGIDGESDADDIAAIKDASLSAQDVVDLISLSTNMDELSAIWKKYKGFQTNKDVIAAKNNKKKELSDGNK